MAEDVVEAQVEQGVPVTVVVARRARRGRVTEFEEALRGATESAKRFPGHHGTAVFRPGDPDSGEYRVVLFFDSQADADDWSRSRDRRTWLGPLDALSSEPPTLHHETGMEAWFTEPSDGTQGAPRHKVLGMTWSAAFPLITLLFLVFGGILEQLPLLLRTALLSGTLLTLMTYVVMPRVKALYRPWLESANVKTNS